MGLLGLAGSLLGMIPKVGSPSGAKKGKSGGSKGKSSKKSSKKKSSTKKKQKKSSKKKKKKKRKKKKKKWGKFFTKARKLYNKVSKSKIAKQFKKVVKSAVLATKKAYKQTVSKTKEVYKQTAAKTKEVYQQTKQIVKEVKQTTKEIAIKTKSTAKTVAKEIKNPVVKSFNSFKEIGKDFKDGLDTRKDKALNSPYDFANYLTLGAVDGIWSGAKSRKDKMFNSPSDFLNYATSGLTDMVKGSVNPKDPLSKEHWLDSFGVATSVLGVKGVSSTKPNGVTSGKTNSSSSSSNSNKGTGEVEKLQRGKYADHLDKLYDKYGKLTSEQINQRINLRGETRNELERQKQIYNGEPNFGKGKMGPALAGVYDKKTGEYYHAINTIDGTVPELVPLLRNRLDNMPKEVFDSYSQRSKGAGSHAEVLAVNEALKMNPSAKIEDLTVNVIRTGINKNMPGGVMFKCCPHCSYLLDGFEVISEVSKVGR
ncbi:MULTISPECIES: YwqJ-related putative deaminase [Lysinibacillus]|jgi:hypothetical protein|uniref:YwqJ-related putative deaminase n=1 Tax=Lysinibacillus TaxID=400634 RepID=UPI0009E09363|nr:MULTISPECIES: YwqJ-related putative deaminase [Lysinibacillus]